MSLGRPTSRSLGSGALDLRAHPESLEWGMEAAGASNVCSPSQPPTCHALFLQSKEQVQSQAGSPMKPKISSQNVGPRTTKSRVSEAAVLGQGAWVRETQLLWLPDESARTDILEALGLQWELISFEM